MGKMKMEGEKMGKPKMEAKKMKMEGEEMSKEEKAVEKLKGLLSTSEIEFLKKEVDMLGKGNLAKKVKDEAEEIMNPSKMEESDTYGELSPKEKKIRSIINKVINSSAVISTLGIVPASMFSGGAAGVGFAVAAIASFLLKDAAYWNKKGGIHRDAWEEEN
jgi:hypothetical protein